MDDFLPDQKLYLEGFVSGLQSGRAARGLAPIGGSIGATSPEPSGPDAIHIKAQDATIAAGKKLVDQEKWKRAEHPFDAWARFKAQGLAGDYPKPEDNFRWRYYGLFYVAPAQNSYMCRLRIPNGILTHWQFAGCADLSEKHGGGYAHVTTRANLQIREITAQQAPLLVEAIQDLGLTSKGSGADNIRNVTGSATAGIDPKELFDTRPLAHEWHHHILNTRAIYGLPRKFNVAFDGGGIIPTLEETNDIGFAAVMVRPGADVSPGLWFRLALGGISGHRDLARDTGIILAPQDCTPVADAIVRVFSQQGDRTNRAKARLKYVLDTWGFERFIQAVEEQLGRKLTRIDTAHLEPRPPFDRAAHIGVHRQKQAGLNWVGVVLPLGRMSADQMRGLATLARDHGDGDIRLTVWQNLLLSGVPDHHLPIVKDRLVALGLDWQASAIRTGLVACTGNRGCKFAASDTKGHALQIADALESRLTLDQPVNIHLTGCHHSCAQHYIGDIGLIGAKVPVNEDGDSIEGYDIVIGGGFADQAGIGRPLCEKIKAQDCAPLIESLLRAWMEGRTDRHESFQSFTARHSIEELRQIIFATEAMA